MDLSVRLSVCLCIFCFLGLTLGRWPVGCGWHKGFCGTQKWVWTGRLEEFTRKCIQRKCLKDLRATREVKGSWKDNWDLPSKKNHVVMHKLISWIELTNLKLRFPTLYRHIFSGPLSDRSRAAVPTITADISWLAGRVVSRMKYPCLKKRSPKYELQCVHKNLYYLSSVQILLFL